jgi:hypothetical protein
VTSTSTPDFLSGASGQVVGLRYTTKAVLLDALCDAIAVARLERRWLRKAAAESPPRRILTLAIEHEGEPTLLRATRTELKRSRHHVDFEFTDVGGRGKFENLNALLERTPAEGYDWLLVLDDDVALPGGFLDAFILLAERFGLKLAQPAHRYRSHAAWKVTRRRAASLVRETAFVEIGPVSAFHASTFSTLLPFPPLRIGWGLDAHWSAVARERGWKLGIVDATPVRHESRQIAAAYDREVAIDEARRFLGGRPYTPADEAQRTIAIHRALR